MNIYEGQYLGGITPVRFISEKLSINKYHPLTLPEELDTTTSADCSPQRTHRSARIVR
jgi:hypothetical protein